MLSKSGTTMHKEFVAANPMRHCKGEGEPTEAVCLICGRPCERGIVYCPHHKGTMFPHPNPAPGYSRTVGWGNAEFYPLLYAHPDFNGIVPPEHRYLIDSPRLCDSEWIATIDAE